MMGSIRTIQVVAAGENQHCGVKDYALHLAATMSQESSRVVTITPSAARVTRDRIAQLKDMRKDISRQVLALPQASLVHVQYADFSWNGTRICEDLYELFSRKCRIPLVLTVHEHPWLRAEHETDKARTLADRAFALIAGYRRLPSSISLEILRRHRAIHVHHAWHKALLVSSGVPASIIRVEPNFIPDCKASPDQIAVFKRRFELDGKRIIAAAGFVFERKRYERLLDLLPDLPSDTVLCVLGGANGRPSEQYLATLNDRAKALGVSSRFVVTGYLPEAEMNAGLQAADVFAAPYGEVTSSGSVARCIGSGAPIVAWKCQTFDELEANGAGLVVVDPEDREAIRHLVLKLLDRKESGVASGLRQKNASYAGRWSLSNVAREIQAWYGECV